jgi:hypothetical protein
VSEGTPEFADGEAEFADRRPPTITSDSAVTDVDAADIVGDTAAEHSTAADAGGSDGDVAAVERDRSITDSEAMADLGDRDNPDEDPGGEKANPPDLHAGTIDSSAPALEAPALAPDSDELGGGPLPENDPARGESHPETPATAASSAPEGGVASADAVEAQNGERGAEEPSQPV